MWTEWFVSEWLIPSAVSGSLVLLSGSLIVLACRQPIRRLVLARLTILACLLLPLLLVVPGYPRLRISAGISESADGQESRNSMTPVVGRSARQHGEEARGAAPPAGAEPDALSAPSSVDPTNHRIPRPLPAVSQQPTVPWAGIILICYAAGVGALLVWWCLGLVVLWRLTSASRPAPEWVVGILREVAERSDRSLRLCISDRVAQPVVFLGWRPTILLPEAFCCEERRRALRWSLAHEWSHLERQDALFWHATGLAAALFFYNPLVWWLRRRVRLDQEYLADGRACEQDPATVDYADFLLGLPRGGGGLLACRGVGMIERRSDLFRRISMMLENRRPLERRCPGSWCVAMASVTLAVLAVAPMLRVGASPAETVRSHATSDETAASPATSDSRQVEKIAVTVVDAQGRPVSGVPVYGCDRRGRVVSFTTDPQGRVLVPRSWTEDEDSHTLVARQGQALVGWSEMSRDTFASGGASGEPPPLVLVPRSRTIRGRCVDPSGEPLADIPIVLRSVRGTVSGRGALYGSALDRDLLGRTLSGASGRFSLRSPETLACEVVTRHPRYAVRRWKVKAGEDDLGDLVLLPGGAIAGRVTDGVTGAPVSGALIGAQRLEVETVNRHPGSWGGVISDRDGRYRIEGVAPLLYNVLFTPPPGMPHLTAVAAEAVEVQPGGVTAVDFQVLRGRQVSGKVLNAETNEPLPGVSVGYYGPARPRSGGAIISVSTDAAGNFVLHLPPGESYLYICDSHGAGRESGRTLVIPQDRDPPPVVLLGLAREPRRKPPPPRLPAQPAAPAKAPPAPRKVPAPPPAEEEEDGAYTLEVRFRTWDGRPVPLATIGVWVKGRDYWLRKMIKAGRGFTIHDEKLFGGRHRGKSFFLTIEAEGYARPTPPEFTAGEVMPPLTVNLERAVRVPVRGRVVGEEGKPLAGATVWVSLAIHEHYPEPRAGERAAGVDDPWGPECQTDTDGRFEVRHLRVGDVFAIHAGKAGYAGVKSERRRLLQTTAVDLGDLVTGRANGIVAGRVVDADGKGVAGATVTYNGFGFVQARTDATGSFRLEGLPDGVVPLRIGAQSFRRRSEGVEVGRDDIEIQLRPQ